MKEYGDLSDEEKKYASRYAWIGFIGLVIGWHLLFASAYLDYDWLFWIAVVTFYGRTVASLVLFSRKAGQKFTTLSLWRCFAGALEIIILFANAAVAIYFAKEESNPFFIIGFIVFLILYNFIGKSPSGGILPNWWQKRPFGKIPDFYVLSLFLMIILMTFIFGARFYFLYLN